MLAPHPTCLPKEVTQMRWGFQKRVFVQTQAHDVNFRNVSRVLQVAVMKVGQIC
jgi:hypothetical protein